MKIIRIFIFLLFSISFISALKQLIDLNPKPKPNLLTYRNIYKINAINNADRYGTEYIRSGKFLDEQTEYNIKKELESSYDGENKSCYFNIRRFMEELNRIRDKHQVKNVQWDNILADQAKIYANRMKFENACFYKNRLMFSELFSHENKRITEKELLEKWYEPVYGFDFTRGIYELEKVNGYSMAILLWDEVDKVGCSKVCCFESELIICDFQPYIIQPTVGEMAQHIFPNKNLPIKMKRKTINII